nr:condensation domain-containing protein [Glycomyces sp. L485]
MAWEAWLTFQHERRAQYPGLNFEYEVPAGTEIPVVEQAVAALVERHEVLRTTFHADEEGLPLQRVWAAAPVEVHAFDRVTDPEAVEAFKSRDFAIDTEWPCRFALVANGGGRHSVLACFPHIVIDDQGREILMRDFGVIADAAVRGKAPDLPPVACHPVDYARHERSESSRRLRERSKRYWQAKLDEIPAGVFDLASEPAFTRFVSCRQRSVAAADRLTRIAAGIGVPRSAVFSAVFSLALAETTAKDLLPLQISTHGRITADALQLVAPLARDLVIAVSVRSEQPFDEFARELQRLAFEAVRYSMVDTLEFGEWKAIAGARRGGEIGSRISLNFMEKTGVGRIDEASADSFDQWDCTTSDPVEYLASTPHLFVDAGVSPQGMEVLVFGAASVVGEERIESLARSITDLLVMVDKAADQSVGKLRREISKMFTSPSSEATSALVRCAQVVNGLPSMDPGLSYAETGGRFYRIPAVLRELKRIGYAGLDWHDLQQPCSLATLATKINRVADTHTGRVGGDEHAS